MATQELQRKFSLANVSTAMPKTPLRRLPSLPGTSTGAGTGNARPQSRLPSARPLPPIPRPLVCKRCKSHVTCISLLLPLSKIPPRSRAFRGFNGSASLFTEIHHVNLSSPVVHLMNTGAHTMEEISCSTCHSYLGWHIVRAHSSSERWKEGHFLLELENLTAKMDGMMIPRKPRSVASSSSDSDE